MFYEFYLRFQYSLEKLNSRFATTHIAITGNPSNTINDIISQEETQAINASYKIH
jgi:hypothetical protein